MKFVEAINDGMSSVVSWLMVSSLAGIGWLVRRVFTNQKQIEQLQIHLENRDKDRERDREEIRGLRTKVDNIHDNIMKLFQDRQ